MTHGYQSVILIVSIVVVPFKFQIAGTMDYLQEEFKVLLIIEVNQLFEKFKIVIHFFFFEQNAKGV